MRKIIKILTLFFGLIFFGQKSKACICIDPFLTIDSLAQLNEYNFIAHVRITDDKDFKIPSKNDYETIGLLTFEIIELFKGKKLNQVLQYSKYSSCEIGVSIGEEWILFGKIIDGKTSIVACDRNQRYKDRNEQRDWKYERGFYELKQLRKIFNLPSDKFENAKRQEFYKSGKIEIEENYINGKLHGERKIWYPNGNLLCKQFYVNDTLDGKSEWFYPSGQIDEEGYYIMGKPCNVSRIYYDSTIEESWKQILINDFYKSEDSLIFVYNRVQPQYETVFDSYGQAIISREYTRIGKIHSEEFFNPETKFRVIIYYHNKGTISSIMYSLNEKNYGHYQTYDEDGFPDRGWDYDENGEEK